MKKTIIIITILFGLGVTSYADPTGGGLFQKGAEPREYTNRSEGDSPMLPNAHNQTTDQGAPLGSGVAVLMGLGAGYLMGKRRKE